MSRRPSAVCPRDLPTTTRRVFFFFFWTHHWWKNEHLVSQRKATNWFQIPYLNLVKHFPSTKITALHTSDQHRSSRSRIIKMWMFDAGHIGLRVSVAPLGKISCCQNYAKYPIVPSWMGRNLCSKVKNSGSHLEESQSSNSLRVDPGFILHWISIWPWAMWVPKLSVKWWQHG